MKLSCNKKTLADAVAGVSRAVSSASFVPILQGILLKADGFNLGLTGYDMQTAITTTIAANVMAPGAIVLPAKLLSDMIKGLSGEDVEIEADESLAVKIKSGITEYNFMALSAEDFPQLPSPGADTLFEIDGAELANMINSTIYAVSTDEKRPAHTGLLFAIKNGEITIVGFDGFRIALAKYPVQTSQETEIVVPAKTAAEVSRLLGGLGGSINIEASFRYIVFSGGGYTIISRLLEGEFLNYENAIPKEIKTKITVNSADFEKAIERCSVIITERIKNPLRVIIGENEIKINCQTTLGKVYDKIEAQVEGEGFEIGFNYRYLLDALRNIGTDKVLIETTGPLSPIKITPNGGDESLALVLPVRLANE